MYGTRMGKEYVDYVASWGAIIHGHADDRINEAISAAALRGTSYGAPHEGEILLARELIQRVPAAEKVRFVNSGTEATVSAIRLARAATSRHKIIKFEGNYHGAADCLLASAGSGVATFSLPDSSGVPPSSTADTLIAVFNDLESVERLFAANSGEVAAIIVEPTSGNMGLVPVNPGFLRGLRELCDRHTSLLILDEVMTGFRVARGGASELYGVSPDLFCFGKVIGGGLPVGAYGGSAKLMEWVAPLGPMYQAGTLSGNPLAMAAGLASLQALTANSYAKLEGLGAKLQSGLETAGRECGVAMQVQRVGSMISVFFTEGLVANFAEAAKTNRPLYGSIFHHMLERGFYLPPSALESWFITLSHTETEIEATVEAFYASLKEAA